jgi:hypothetical protein
MQFAYLDPSEPTGIDALFGTVMAQFASHRNTRSEPETETEVEPAELPEHWTSFKDQLFEFQKEYARNMQEAKTLMAKLREKNKYLEALNNMAKLVEPDTELKDSIYKILADYESKSQRAELEAEIERVRGVCAAQQQILTGTNTEAQTRFQCFVCMDRQVEVFLDPCGHVMCEQCWNRHNTPSCPGCRAQVRRPRKIFTLS